MDSLDADKFKRMTGGDLSLVLQSIDEAIKAGLLPLKINAVVIRGKNDDEIDAFIELAKDRPLDVRFIELMPMGRLGQDASLRVPSDEMIKTRPYLIPVAPRYPGQPSTDYRIEGYRGRIGFISPISHQFCGECNRIRVLSDGTLRPCLGRNATSSPWRSPIITLAAPNFVSTFSSRTFSNILGSYKPEPLIIAFFMQSPPTNVFHCSFSEGSTVVFSL
jgi:cyclic pyranopterin phosphate synthase